jgi:hypothetical protein
MRPVVEPVVHMKNTYKGEVAALSQLQEDQPLEILLLFHLRLVCSTKIAIHMSSYVVTGASRGLGVCL